MWKCSYASDYVLWIGNACVVKIKCLFGLEFAKKPLSFWRKWVKAIASSRIRIGVEVSVYKKKLN